MRKSNILRGLVVLAFGIVVVCSVYFSELYSYKKNINSINIEEVDLQTIEDGEYIGEYNAGFIYAKVMVTVREHEITDVELLEHKHERGATAEVIVKSIASEGRIDVDEVSGATNSSLVIKMACVKALIR